MSREKATYRDNMEMLNERFPDKDALTRADVAAVLGVSLRSRVLGRIKYNERTRMVSKADFARQICV